MAKQGYIYVLANSSMPDLVKVGKTMRSAAQRAQELSGVSGVPTPFIVVYEQLFEDCTVAEDFLHTILKQKGYHEADNREFFRVPANKIIRIISEMSGQITALTTPHHEDDELDDFLLDEQTEYPWSNIWDAAEKYRYGLEDCLQDDTLAMTLYREATKLGCLMGYSEIGDMYLYGEGVPESSQKALENYKEGAKKGNYYCYYQMLLIYKWNKDLGNFHKCMILFLKNRKDQLNPIMEEKLSLLHAYESYLTGCFELGVSPLTEIVIEMTAVKYELLKVINSLLELHQNPKVVNFSKGRFDDQIKYTQEANKFVSAL